MDFHRFQASLRGFFFILISCLCVGSVWLMIFAGSSVMSENSFLRKWKVLVRGRWCSIKCDFKLSDFALVTNFCPSWSIVSFTLRLRLCKALPDCFNLLLRREQIFNSAGRARDVNLNTWDFFYLCVTVLKLCCWNGLRRVSKLNDSEWDLSGFRLICILRVNCVALFIDVFGTVQVEI